MSFVFVDWDDQLHTRECGCPAGAGGTREAAVAWWETPGAPESHQPPEHQHLLLVLVSPSGAQPIYTTWCLSSNSWGSTGSLLHISWQQLWGATQSAPCCPNLHEILAMPWQQNNKLLAPGLKSRKAARGAVARGQKTQEGGLLIRWDGDEKKKGTEHWWDDYEFCKDQSHLLSWAETNNVCIFHKNFSAAVDWSWSIFHIVATPLSLFKIWQNGDVKFQSMRLTVQWAECLKCKTLDATLTSPRHKLVNFHEKSLRPPY